MLRIPLFIRTDRRRVDKPLCEWCRKPATMAFRGGDSDSPDYACERHAALFGEAV